jgi:hypothetical protein
MLISITPVVSCDNTGILRPMGTVIGTVVDSETSDPIPGALITIRYHDEVQTALTDSQGEYVFTCVPDCFCLKNISAQKRGYEDQHVQVSVFEITYVNFSLKPTGKNKDPTHGVITGVVTDAETNEPIPETLMTLKYHDVVRTDFTDSKGRYKFNRVPICFCMKNVSAEKKGYEEQYKLVAVYKITYVNFSLEPIDDNGSMYGIITGVVTDSETGEPIPETLMTLEYHDIVRTGYTDSKGWYKFDKVPICFCLKNLSAAKRGYEIQYELVAVSEVTYVNFSLVSDSEDDHDSNSISGMIEDEGAQIWQSGNCVLASGAIFTSIALIFTISYLTKKRKVRT